MRTLQTEFGRCVASAESVGDLCRVHRIAKSNDVSAVCSEGIETVNRTRKVTDRSASTIILQRIRPLRCCFLRDCRFLEWKAKFQGSSCSPGGI